MVPSLSSQNNCGVATSGVVSSTGVNDSGIVGDVSVGVVFVMVISCCMSMLQKAKIPHDFAVMGIQLVLGRGVTGQSALVFE